MYNWSTLKKLIWLYAAKLKGGAQAIIETITGNLPLVLQNAIEHAIKSLTRYGLCTQDGTPTPSAPVDILCNNGALQFGWHDVITTSALTGYGTYVSPTQAAGARAYKWFKDLPNGTYTFSVDGDYEIIVQWRDPADPSVLVPSSYENLSGWMTSGDVVLGKESGGYGIAVRRTSGTSSITPSNFDGTLHVQEQGIYTDGTPEVLTVSGQNLLNAATNITGKYIGSNGSISSGDDAQYTDLIPVNEGETYVCSFVSGRNSGNNRWHGYDANGGWVKQLAVVSATGQQGARLVMTATIDSGISYVRLSYGITDTEAMICLADSSNQISADGYYLGAQVSGTVTTSKNAPIQSPYTSANQFNGPAIVFSVLSGRVYAVKSNAVTNYTAIRFACYNNIEDINNNSKAVSRGEGAAFVAPDGANYAVVAYINNASGVTFTFDEPFASEIGDYSPYVHPQTASVPMLLSVGDYADEAEIISGGVMRKVGVKVLDGTEAWTLNGTMRYVLTISDMATLSGRTEGMCTHFSYAGSSANAGTYFLTSTRRLFVHTGVETVDDFKAWLASEYANGTPVIVVYPLATATTEQTTAQQLVTHEGTNVVDSVANVGPLTAEVKYMTASAQDVLSTLLGMKVTRKDISTQDAEDMINIITGEDNNK